MAKLFVFAPSSARRLAATYRGLAKARHADAVRHLEMGDRDKFLAMLRDVDAFEDQARAAEAAADAGEVALARAIAERMAGEADAG